MSAGRAYAVTSTPPLTVSGVGPPRTLTGREAAIVLALLRALEDARSYPDAEVRLAWWGEHVATPAVSRRVRVGR